MAKHIQLNSGDLELFKKIEKSLWKFFRLFDNLCLLCYQETIKQIKEGDGRDNRKHWCCCMIDNQVHDNWDSLNTIQQKIGGKDWYKKIKKEAWFFQNKIIKRKMPGNGPCPALGKTGCIIKRFRPITCSTQLCEKMLYILAKSSVENITWSKPLQIEDIVKLPNILKTLYGLNNERRIYRQHAKEYIKSVNKLRMNFSLIDASKKEQLIKETIHHFLARGGK